MKRFYILVLLAVVALSLGAFAQDDQGGGPRGGRGGRQMPSVDDQVGSIKQAVNLSDEQAGKVHDILQAQRDKAQQMMQDSSVSRDDRRAKMQALREDSNNQIRALLSDDQKKSYDSYLKQQRENRRRDNGGGPN
jgi:periplasmic protein CpxP/Spy